PVGGGDLGPELVIVYLLDDLAGYECVGKLGVQVDREKAGGGGPEEQRGGGQQEGGGCSIGLGQGAPIEDSQLLARLALRPVDGGVPSRHQSVQVARDRFGWPVALCPGQVRGRPAVERRQRQDFTGAESQGTARACAMQ